MLPFCGYHVADYFEHWLAIGRSVANPPKIFTVNWFRKDVDGKFIWPGFGENMRVLRWIFERCRGRARAVATVLGWQPEYGDLEWTSLDFGPDRFAQVMNVNSEEWQRELAAHDQFFSKLGTKQPPVLRSERSKLGARLER